MRTCLRELQTPLSLSRHHRLFWEMGQFLTSTSYLRISSKGRKMSLKLRLHSTRLDTRLYNLTTIREAPIILMVTTCNFLSQHHRFILHPVPCLHTFTTGNLREYQYSNSSRLCRPMV